MNKHLILNALGFNAVWFAWALGVPAGQFIVPLFFSLLFILWHLKTSIVINSDIRLIAISSIAGFAFDTALQALGWVQFVAPNLAPLSAVQPWWMAFMWAAFACTLNHSMAWLRSIHWVVAALLSGIFGCLSYFGAAKLGTLQVASGVIPMLALFVFWAVFVPLVQKMTKSFSSPCKHPNNTSLPASF